MEYFLNSKGSVIIKALVKVIQDNKDYLSEIDGAIGDGDHGVNMNKGFTIFEEKIGNNKIGLSTTLKMLGIVLLTEIGGSVGPLYGTLFIEMSKKCSDKKKIDKKVFEDMLKAGLKGVQSLGNAKVGDKTLIDTLMPAVEAYEKAIKNDKNFIEALKDFKEAAKKGKESTRNMVAKIGRASRLGERSRGILDAGATSCNLIFQTMADTIIVLLTS